MKIKLLVTSLCFFFLLIQNAHSQAADAEVTTFASPTNLNFCPAQLPISINIYNNDLIDITEVVLNWSINSVAQSPVTWSGLIAAGDIAAIELNPSYDFLSGTTYDIEVSISTVNSLPDPNSANDVNMVSFQVYEVFIPIFYWNGCSLECLNASDYLSIQWYRNGSPDPNAPNTGIYTPAQAGNYTMTGLTYDSCDAVADTTIFANPPTHGITPLGVTAFCEGDSVGLVFTASEQVFYTWNTGSSDDTIYASMDGWYSINGLTVNSCPIIDSIHVTVHPTPVVSISDMNDTLVSTYSGLHQWYLNGTQIGGAHDSTYVPTGSGIYYCTVTDVYGCTGTSNSINWIFPGISIPVKISDVMLYPNPAKDVVNIKFNSGKENLELKIFDAVGRLVLGQIIFEDTAIDISELKAGVYQCVFTGEGKMSSQKLVKTF